MAKKHQKDYKKYLKYSVGIIVILLIMIVSTLISLQELRTEYGYLDTELQNKTVSLQELRTDYDYLDTEYILLKNNLSNLELDYFHITQEKQEIKQNYQKFKTETEEVMSTALTPPYMSIENQTVYIVFWSSNGETIEWIAPFESLNSDLQRGYFKREYVDENLIPLHTEYAEYILYFANSCFNGYINTCNQYQKLMNYCGGGNAECNLLHNQLQDEQNDLVNQFASSLTKLKKQGTEHLTLNDNGNSVTVMDFRSFVDESAFEIIIPKLYYEINDEKEFIYEMWYIVSQLTTYSFDIEETPKYPLETLLSGGGDCEDTSILVASMLKAVPKNWKINLVYMDADNPSSPKEVNHIIVHVETDKENYYIETTSKEEMNPYGKVVGWYLEV